MISLVLFFLFALSPLQGFQLEPSLVNKYIFRNSTKHWHVYVRGFAFFFVFKSFVLPNSENYTGNVVVLFLQRVIKKSNVFTKAHLLKGGDILWYKQRMQLMAIKR